MASKHLSNHKSKTVKVTLHSQRQAKRGDQKAFRLSSKYSATKYTCDNTFPGADFW
jgi:hypothetical protein